MSTLTLSHALLASALAGGGAPAADTPVGASSSPVAPAAPVVSPGGALPAEECAPGALRIAQAPPATGAGGVSVGDVRIFGDSFETDPATGLITVTGSPRVVRGEDEVRATRLIINPRTLQVVAEGNVILRQGRYEVQAARATYSLAEKSGQADNARTRLKAYHVDAEQLLIRRGPVYEALRSRFTTCEPPHRHYELYSRSMEIIPDDRLVARSTGIDLLGVRLLTIPRLAKSLEPGDDGRSLIPSLGFDSFNGLYARQEFELVRRAPMWVDADLQLNTLREPNAGLRAATPGQLQFVGTLYYRDVSPNQSARHLQVSRLPEVGLVWGRSRRPQPGRFLSNQVPGVRYPEDLDISTSVRFAAQVTAGYFRQHRGDTVPEPDALGKDGGRINTQLQAVLPLAKAGPLVLNDLRVMARQSFYDSGDRYTVLGTGIGKKVRIGNLRLRVDRFDQFTGGTTPFVFDEVELKEEWRPQLDYETPGFTFSYTARIRGRSGELFDQVFSVSKLFHCLEPRITYRVRRQQFFFELRIPGLSGRNRTRPGEPASVDPGLGEPAADTAAP